MNQSRRHFIQTMGIGVSSLAAPQFLFPQRRRPNIILCMTDDQGIGDLGFYGNPDISTPVLDSLARDSIRFNQFYVSPVCAPTRSSLMTGRYSLRTGVFDTYNGGAIMAAEEVTIAEILSDAGYRTGIFGKWHLGDNYPFRPQDQGFHETLVHAGGGIGQVGDIHNYFKFDKSYFNPVLSKNGRAVQTTGYCSDVFTDGALEFIDKNARQPFFLYLAYNAPHTPLQVPESYYEMYRDMTPDVKRYPRKGRPVPELSDRDLEAAKKVYSMVSNIDDNLGRVLARVHDLGLEENTMVVFLTDNGPQQRRYTAGLRGRKGSVYEGGVRVPCFIRYPGLFPENVELNTAAAHYDIFPTILDVCGIAHHKGNPIDGKSLIPLIKGKAVPWTNRSLHFHWQRSFPEPYRNIAVRKGNFKLVGQAPYTARPEDFELFDIKKDPYESDNISLKFPEITGKLKQDFDTWLAEIIESPHLKQTQRIQLGSLHENPVLLNRNDARGSEAIWAQDRVYGYWDVSVENDGLYDFSFHFREPLKQTGVMKLRLGTLQRSLNNRENGLKVLEMKGIRLKRGRYRLEPWYRANGGNHLPFYVEVLKKN